MPLTFAHPAIVLPLRQSRYFHFPALVIGSMAPDFEYFYRMQAFSTYSHTIGGIFSFDLPLVLVIWLLFARVVKRPLIAHMPAFLAKSFRAADPPIFRSWLVGMIFTYSALLGIASHLAWDAFTHAGAFAVTRLPFLQQQLLLAGFHVPVFKLLQHGSTFFGLLAIVFVIGKAGRSNPIPLAASHISLRSKWLYWLGIGTGGVVTAFLYIAIAKGSITLSSLLTGIVPFLSGSLIALLFLSWMASRRVLKK